MVARDGFEAAVLKSLYRAVGKSKAAHVPEPAFAKNFPGKGRMVKKALKLLIREGYVQKHPTGGEMTYELTDLGWDLCKKMEKEAR
jgi:hypothetical protein